MADIAKLIVKHIADRRANAVANSGSTDATTARHLRRGGRALDDMNRVRLRASRSWWRSRVELRSAVVRPVGAHPALRVALGIPVETYRQDYGPMLVDGPHSQSWGEEDATALEGVADLEREAPHERLTREDLLRLVAQKLTVQEYRLVYLKYWEELSMREIGELMRLSESRLCKIHMRLLERLKDRFHANNGE